MDQYSLHVPVVIALAHVAVVAVGSIDLDSLLAVSAAFGVDAFSCTHRSTQEPQNRTAHTTVSTLPGWALSH